VVNHILGGLINFYLGVCTISKAAVGRINWLLQRFIWNKESDKDTYVGWQWCTFPRELDGLGLLNILAKGKVLASKWTIRALGSREFWAACYRGYIGAA